MSGFSSAYAPFNLSYAQTAPYITPSEFQQSPEALDLSDLAAGFSSAINQAQLATLIAEASSWADSEVFGAYGTLCATLNTENGDVWTSRNGSVTIFPQFWPVLEVAAFSYGYIGGVMTEADPSAVVTDITPTSFTVLPTAASQFFGLGNVLTGLGPAKRTRVTYSYVNGWPNTLLSASVMAGASSIVPVSLTGIYPGTALGIIDPPYTEQIVVSADYMPGSSPVALVAPLVNNHQAGVMVSNIPMRVKQACALYVKSLIKTSGNSDMVLESLQTGPRPSGTGVDPSVASDMALARQLLRGLEGVIGGLG